MLANDKLVALLGAEPHTHLNQAAQAALVDLGLTTVPTGAPLHEEVVISSIGGLCFMR